jgi:hypothetical protein
VCAQEIGDRFANYFNILLLGVLECMCIGRGAKGAGLAAEINRYTGAFKMNESFFLLCTKYLAPLSCALLFFRGVYIYAAEGFSFGGYTITFQILFGWSVSAFVLFFAIFITRFKKSGKISIKIFKKHLHMP